MGKSTKAVFLVAIVLFGLTASPAQQQGLPPEESGVNVCEFNERLLEAGPTKGKRAWLTHQDYQIGAEDLVNTYLTGQSSLDEAIVATSIPNLCGIPCGPSPPNPAELLSSSQSVELLNQAEDKFHYLLLDSPPVVQVADARILAAQAEAVILVAQ